MSYPLLIVLSIILTIILSSLIVLLPEINTSYKDIVLNWSDVGKILGGGFPIGTVIVGGALTYFGKYNKNRKKLWKEEAQQQKEEQKYRERAEKLIIGIQNSFKEIYKDVLSDMSSLKTYQINSLYYGTTFDRYYTTQFQNYTSLIFSEKEQRTLVNRILTRMNIFSEYQHRDDIKHSFFIDSLMENYKTEWGDEPSNNVRSFCNVVEKLAEEFDSDKHLETVINILKDIGE